MASGLPDYAYRQMYDKQYANQDIYPPPPLKPVGNSNDSDRGRRRIQETTRRRIEDDYPDEEEMAQGQYHSERRIRTSEMYPRRRPASSYRSDSTYDSRDSRHYDDHRNRGRSRSRNRRRSMERNRHDRQIQQQKKQHEKQQQAEPKKAGFAKIEEYITPFNVGIMMGCMDLIGGTVSLYMTHKRFSKKALANGPSPGEPGSSGGRGGGDDAPKGHSSGSSGTGTSSRSSHTSRGRRADDRYSRSRRGSESSSADSYDSRDYDRRRRDMPRRIEYDDRGRPAAGAARAAHHSSRRR